MDLCVLLAPQQDINWEEITSAAHIMVIGNAPFLERLLVSDLEGPTKIRVIDAPKLTALVYSFAKFSELFIGSVIVQVHHSSSSPSS